jgi:hypothetical protein
VKQLVVVLGNMAGIRGALVGYAGKALGVMETTGLEEICEEDA